MKVIAVIVALMAIPLVASGALATIPEYSKDPGAVVRPAYRPSVEPKESQFRGEVAIRPAPLKLPNFQARTTSFLSAEKALIAPQMKKSEQVVRFFESRKHHWMLATRHAKCWGVPWQRACTAARANLRLHQALVKIGKQRIWEFQRTIENTGNWTRAMQYAQRPFPGTLDWLSFISNRECRACYTVDGGFVCNYQGSGACGPMQFMSGTFYGHADDARAWLDSHGYIVAPEVWDWHNALGQALTAAFMRYTHIDGCHWCL